MEIDYEAMDSCIGYAVWCRYFNSAATINVSGNCTLGNAINSANSNTSVGTCDPGAGDDTIVLQPETFHLVPGVDNTTFGPTGFPVITSNITIRGTGGSVITRTDSVAQARIFAVGAGAALTLVNLTVTGGEVESLGGGIFVADSGFLALFNSTVSNNRALSNDGGGSGGGIASRGSVLLFSSTVSDNFADFSGGGLQNFSTGPMQLFDSTVTGNSADFAGGIANRNGDLVLVHSLISGNTASASPEVEMTDSVTPGTVFADASNLFGHDGVSGVSGFTPGETDIVPSVSLSAILDTTLRRNGGSTFSHALVAGSPAIDGAQGTCPQLDQRGVSRPQDGDGDGQAICDIGSFEVAAAVTPPGPGPVIPPQTNRSPVVTNPGNQVGVVGQAINLLIPASDPDGDTLSFLATALPSGLSINSTTGRITGTLTSAGTASVTVFVNDSRGAGRIISFSWTVTAASLPPPPPPPPPPSPPPTVVPPPPNSLVGCVGRVCPVRVQCNGVPGTVCMFSAKILLPRKRLTICTAGSVCIRGRAPQFVFGAGVSAVPAGQTANVRIKVKKAGKQFLKTTTKTTVRGTLQVTNLAGGVSASPVRVRLPR